MSQIVTTVHGPHFVKIDWEFDKEKRQVRLVIPGFVETTSEPFMVPNWRGAVRYRAHAKWFRVL